jgi:N-succinyldiaminopimelate aminotransferase
LGEAHPRVVGHEFGDRVRLAVLLDDPLPFQQRSYGLTFDPDTEVLVTAGATEAIAASMLALLEPGDEVVAFEPFYDSYAASIAMAGAARVPLTLRAPDFRPDLDALRDAITSRTRLLAELAA